MPLPPLSVLDLAPIVEGSTPAEALRNSLDLAQHAERWGYRRFWLAEHHNTIGIASAATAVVIAHVAGGTTTIRVGAGGIMLPNHSPLVIAEQFGTLEALHPGPDRPRPRPRARHRPADGPRAAPRAARAPTRSRRTCSSCSATSPTRSRASSCRRRPGAGSHVPLWILGSSLFGAQLAALLGLPYAFASHFAPEALLPALEVYRATFRPSAQLAGART